MARAPGITTIFTFAFALLIGGCGGSGGHVVEAPPPKKEAPKPKPVAHDAFRDFGGKVVAPGEHFRLQSKPIGVKGLEVVIQLVKTEWTERELPSGKTVKDGTADILIKKGEASRRVRLDEGESRVIYGAKILVHEAHEGYDPKRMDYLPWIDVVVSKP